MENPLMAATVGGVIGNVPRNPTMSVSAGGPGLSARAPFSGGPQSSYPITAPIGQPSLPVPTATNDGLIGGIGTSVDPVLPPVSSGANGG